MYRSSEYLSLQTYTCVVYGCRVERRMISGRVVREGGKPPSVLQFIWSFIKEGEREKPEEERVRVCGV